MNASSTSRKPARSVTELVRQSDDSLGATLVRLAELAAAAHLHEAEVSDNKLCYERTRSQGRLQRVDGSDLFAEPGVHREVNP